MSKDLILMTALCGLALTQCSGDSPNEIVKQSAQRLQGGLTITTALAFSEEQVNPGDTVTGTVTYANQGTGAVSIENIAIAARPPGGTHAGGPYDDFGPYTGPLTLAAGQSVTVTATRAFSSSDPTGAWDVYSTYEDSSGTWWDGTDGTLLVGVSGVQDGALEITSALSLSESNVSPGDTVTGTVTFTNDGVAPVAVANVVIAARPPGGTHSGGPFDDFTPPSPSQTLAPGASITLTATRAFSAADPAGSWDLYPTWEDGSGAWHDGPDFALTFAGASQPPPPPPSGGFTVANGQIVGPNGQPFIAKGIDLDQSIPASQVTPLFPGINFIRLPSGPSTSASELEAEVTPFTNAGIVVEIEDHPWPEVAPYTGADLATETSWYASLAAAFVNDPYVWFGTMNEPQTAYGSAEAAISTQEAAIYQAIRGTGNNTIIMMELMGGGNPGTVGAGFGMTPSTYTSMTNMVWDLHFYGWAANYSTDQGTVNAALLGSVSAGQGIVAAQTITSADGLVPVIIGEYGNSTDGQNVDANGDQVIQAVRTSGYGAAAWEDSPYCNIVADCLVDGSGNVTAYGQSVAAHIATGD